MIRAKRSAAVAVILIAAAVLVHRPAGAGVLLDWNDEGSWLGADKELHFAGSLALSASLAAAGRERRDALAGSLSVGIAKELYDATIKPGHPRGVSRKDLLADVLGAVAGVLLVEVLDR